MATTSQKMMEIKFLVRIRGALTPPPTMDTPVVQMPLCDCQMPCLQNASRRTYHAEPTTERPMHSAMPTLANVYGEILSRKAPTWGPVSHVCSVLGQTRAYVEGLSFVVEEHVWPSLAIAYAPARCTYTSQPHRGRRSRHPFRR
jgi:hypothetical protein